MHERSTQADSMIHNYVAGDIRVILVWQPPAKALLRVTEGCCRVCAVVLEVFIVDGRAGAAGSRGGAEEKGFLLYVSGSCCSSISCWVQLNVSFRHGLVMPGTTLLPDGAAAIPLWPLAEK